MGAFSPLPTASLAPELVADVDARLQAATRLVEECARGAGTGGAGGGGSSSFVLRWDPTPSVWSSEDSLAGGGTPSSPWSS